MTLGAAAAGSEEGALEETRRTLIHLARKRFGSIPAEMLVEHVLRMAGAADFPVRRAALDALERRWGFAVRDRLAVATRPMNGALFGPYTTGQRVAGGARRRRGGGRRRGARRAPRPYVSALESLEPISASCDCPDFLRSSLGLCKHLLVVLDDVLARPKVLDEARRRVAVASRLPRLVWNPGLPLSGALDRLAGLYLEDGAGTARAPRDPKVVDARLRRAFSGGAIALAELRTPSERRTLLALLSQAISGSSGRGRLEASPAARALVAEEIERVERRLRNAEALRDTLAGLRTLKRRLYPYQRAGVERFLASGRLLLADDMGLGKTTQAIAACHALFAAGRVKRGLIIAPASLKPQWLREWQETTDVAATVVDGGPADRVRHYAELRAGFLIMNYEQLLRDFEHVQRLAPEAVVLDEAQRIKNYATKSAAYVKALLPEYRLVLTGTPMENRLEELASILDWVDDVALAPKWRLVPWYTRWQGDGGPSGKVGARHLETLRARLAPCVLRRVRREVLDQLPPRTDTRVPVEMTSQQIEEHDELARPIARLLAIAAQRPLTQAEFLRLMQLLTQQRIIANGLGQLRFESLWPTYSRMPPDEVLLEGLFAPKLLELRRLIADLALAQQRKVVIFSQWRRMLRLAEWSLRDVLGDAGLRAVFFTGAEKPSQRTQSIVDFHDDPRVRVMLLSDAGGVGLNLQRAASACINIELPWNPAVLEQRIARIYRLGQKRPIDVFNLVSEGSIEARIAELLGAKQALFASLFDGTSDEVRFETAASFLKRVERIVDPHVLPVAPSLPRARGAKPGSSEPTTGEVEVDDADDSALGTPPNVDARLAESAVADELPSVELAPLAARDVPLGASDSSETSAAAAASATAGLFAALRVERTRDGGMRIEAPPEVAGALAALFEGMARLLSRAAAPG
jgi:hypothetical protein